MGSRIREYFASQGKNRQRIKKNTDGLPFEVELKNAITRDELPDLDQELKKKYNDEIRQWANDIIRELRYSIPEMGIGGTTLSDSIRANFKSNRGSINKVGYSFKNYGVYVHKGVGRGYEMRGDNVERTAIRQPNPLRRPKPWFNPVIETFMPDLEEIVNKYYSTAVINTVRIYIP